MEYFKKITQKKLCELIESTQRALFISLPSVHEEVRNSLLKLKNDNKNAQVNILIDFDPQTFRQGYGEFDSVSDLIGKVNIKMRLVSTFSLKAEALCPQIKRL